MPAFPTRELEIKALAERLVKGLTSDRETFPTPPVSPEDIEQALAAYDTASDAAIAASAAATSGTAVKDEALNALVEMVKSDLRYAEDAARHDAGKLKAIGWDGTRNRSVTDAPGQVITLEVIKEGKTWIQLGWKKPFDGGKVGAYKVQRRQLGADDWSDAGMAMETEITLDGVDRSSRSEYRVIAVNKVGEGPASNIITTLA